MDEKFHMFMETVDGRFRSFVSQINEYLTENGCKCNIKLQKSGYVVSYVLSGSKRTLATFVSRKTGMKLRIYPEHICEYQSFLDTLPEKVKREIRKASACKRLVNPDDCNPKCVMGYTFTLDGERYQKCRYMAFQPTLSEENNPYIRQFLEQELRAGAENKSDHTYITLREEPQLKDRAAEWFHSKWGVPQEAYLECMEAYLKNETEYGWYLCLDGNRIIGGLGVIENDFHDRKDLTPNVCAVYTEEEYRCKGIAGNLLDMVVGDLKSKGVTPVYLVTDHTGFYERYGWEFLCMVQGDEEPEMTRMYIHK